MAESFSAQMKSFANMTEDKALKVFKRTCLDIASSVIKMTPVDSGRARGNWQPNINTFTMGTTNKLDTSGAETINTVNDKTKELTIGKSFTLSNNLPYIERLEKGWSGQAPSGMTRITLLRFQSILNIANKEIT